MNKSSISTVVQKVKAAPGRPPLPPGIGKEARACLRTTHARMEKVDRLAGAAKLSRNGLIELLIDQAKE